MKTSEQKNNNLNNLTKTKDSFVLHQAQMDPIRGLTNEQKGVLFNAILEYQFDGVIPELDPMLQMAFSFIKNQLDIDNLKYLNACERNRKNGKKGGRPKKEKNEPNKTDRFFKNPAGPDNDNENKNENKNEKINGFDINGSGDFEYK